MMLVRDLLAKTRSRLSDTVGPNEDRLWTDEELIDDYANKVRTDLFTIASGLVIDSTTASDSDGLPLCSLPVVAGTALYQMSERIIKTTRLQLASQHRPLPQMTMAELDAWNANWGQLNPGPPQAYVTDYQTDYYLLVPTPITNDTAALTNSRFPLSPLTHRSLTDTLGFRAEYHVDLIPGILALAFSKGAGIIADVYKPELAAMYEAQFRKRADEIKVEVFRRNKGPQSNRVHRAFTSK